LRLKLTKTILKLELKGDPTSLNSLNDLFNKYDQLVKIADSFIYNVYPIYVSAEQKSLKRLRLKDLVESLDKKAIRKNKRRKERNGIEGEDQQEQDKHKYTCSDLLKTLLHRFIKYADKYYGIDIKYAYLEMQSGLADLMHSNAENAYRFRTLPVLRKLSDTMPIRVSKRPLQENRKNNNDKYYQRTGEFIINGSNIIFRIGGKRNGLYFPIALSFNDAERLKMLSDAIQGNNGLTIGDPCYLVRKRVKGGNSYRYYIQVSVSKNVDKRTIEEAIKNKSVIRIVGVDLGLSKYIATLFCIEVDKANKTYKLIDALGIEGTKEYINAIRKYEEEKKRLQQGKMRGKANSAKISRYKDSEDYTIKNANGDSKRIDLRRQQIGYLCNQIIKFADKNKADIIVVEELKGLNRRLKDLKKIKKVLGKLYNDVNSNGIKSIDEYIKNEAKGKTKDILEILNKIKEYANNHNHNHNHNIRKVTKYILKQRDRIEKRIFLLSVFAYYQFKNELETEALWHDKLLYEVKPSYTSQQCLACRNIDKLNRLTQRQFRCIKCNFKMNADFNASANIALRYVEKLLKIELIPMRNNNDNNDNSSSSSSKQGKGSGTMTITSATTPLHASINASSKAGVVCNNTDGIVAHTMSNVTSTLQGNGEGRPLRVRGQTELPCSVRRLVTLDEFIYEKRGNGG